MNKNHDQIIRENIQNFLFFSAYDLLNLNSKLDHDNKRTRLANEVFLNKFLPAQSYQ